MIAVLGIVSLVRQPVVLTAVDPRHAFSFFREHGWHGFAVLGAVFLVVTGGEALYADMGHFGKRPIRVRVVHAGPAGAPAELLRAGRAPADQSGGGGTAVLPARTGLGAAAARRARDGRRDHRVAGADLRRVLADATGHSAGLLPASRHRAHVSLGDRAGLRAAGELGADAQHHRDRDRLRIVDRAGGCVRHRGDADDGDHGGVAAGRRDRALGLVTRRRLRGHRHIPDHRPGLLRRERAEDYPWRVAAARDWRPAVHADDDVEDGTSDRGGAPDRASGADRGLSRPSRGRRVPRAFPAPRCS